MTEEFLHYLWKYRLYDKNLRLASGESVTIMEPGIHSKDSGPDFFNSRIRIENTLWAGNVEVHIRSSDWFEHKHHTDDAYNSVILHVVFENNISVRRNNGEKIPVLELNNRFNKEYFNRYINIMTNKNWVPCSKMLKNVDRFTINHWLDRVLIEKLEAKTDIIKKQLVYNNNCWEETFYQFMARNFGFKVNGLPFELLAKSLPLKYLGKHKNSKHQLEALLFGQAGLLNGKYNDNYLSGLNKEYRFLRNKYKLNPIESHLWKFMRLRPSNFPTIRISQFANLISRSVKLFSIVIEEKNLDCIRELFNVSVSDYWKIHYTPGKESSKRNKRIGKIAVNLLLINTVIPFLFIYGKTKDRLELMDRALKFLEQIPGESNSITKNWKEIGLSIQTAYNTQALITLKSNYCDRKQCLLCSIGNNLISE